MPPAASDLKHIFLITGPSGSGKSTFMREFVFDQLPKDVSDALPDDAKLWQRTSGNELSRKGLERIRTSRVRSAGLVVHYDIMRPYSRRFELFSNDPAIKQLTSSGAALTVLTIAPSREALLEQFLKRAVDRDYVEWWDRRRWTRAEAEPARDLLQADRQEAEAAQEEQLRLLGLYASKNGLKRCVANDRGNVRLVFVSPEGSRADHPRFRLLRRG